MNKTLKMLALKGSGPVIALLLSFIAGGLFMGAIGTDPFEVYSRFFQETLGTWYGIGQILFKATPLMFTGLAAALAFRGGLFNIGAEGQLIIGALSAAIVGTLLPSFPWYVQIPLCLAAAAAGGALWGGIPGILKSRFGAHEVINTIMMNFIAAAVANYVVSNLYHVPATMHTPQISESAELTRLGSLFLPLRGAPVNTALFIALAACILVYYAVWRTRWGFSLRAVGSNPEAAEIARINIKKTTVTTLLLSGAIAGIGGSNFVLGYKHYFELGFSEGVGFIGIAVALMAKNHPIWIILTSLFFGTLEYGGLTINTLVPKELVNILQALVILLIIVVGQVINRRVGLLQTKTNA